MQSIEAFYEQIEKAKAVLAEKTDEWNRLKAAADEKSDTADRKAEAVSIEQRNYDLRAAERPWVVTIVASLGCLAGIGYFLWRGFVANESMEKERMLRVSIFLGVIILLLIGVGFLRRYLKKKELGEKQTLIDELKTVQVAADAEKCEAVAIAEKAKAALDAAKKVVSDLQEKLFAEHPEEKQRIENEKQAEVEKALAEKAAQDAAYEQMLVDNEERAQRIQLAGEMFDTPRKFLREYGSEFAVFEAAAEMGCEEAQSKVVMVYVGAEYVSGVKADVAKGLELGRKYAGTKKNGSPMVAETLGEIYLFGKGDVQKDVEKAAEWLEQAAACGRKNAMVNLGYSYYTGEGVDQDLEKAKYWLERAAKQGDEQAFRMLEAIKSGIEIKAE